MSVLRVLNLLVRIGGTIALLIGLALWDGQLTGLVKLHMLLGAAAVLGLWGLAVLAWRGGAGEVALSPGMCAGFPAQGIASTGEPD